MREHLRIVLWTYAGVVAVAVIQALLVGFETLGALLILSLFTLLPISGYLLCQRYRGARNRLMYSVFAALSLPVVIFSTVVFLGDTSDPQVYDIAKWCLIMFALQLAAALTLLHFFQQAKQASDSQ